jgi:hypothetical protein
MPVGKTTIAEILDTVVELLTSASEVTIVENGHPRGPNQLDGGNVIAKVSGKPVQPVVPPYAKVVAFITGVFEEASSGGRIRSPIPGGVPDIVRPIDPRILDMSPLGNHRNRLRDAQQQKRQKKSVVSHKRCCPLALILT